MSEKRSSSNEDPAGTPKVEPETPRKPRKHGYRGYPNKPGGGDIHTGSGFGGVGSTGGEGGGLPEPGFISERTREDAAQDDEE